MTRLLVLTHPDCARHDPVPGHPESPARLEAALRGLEQVAGAQIRQPRPAERESLERVHDQRYLDRLESLRDTDRTVALDPDTSAGPNSIAAAARAAGAAMDAVEAVLADPKDRAFAVVRPPGHHAERGRAMGFCLYNSIAVAAAHALEQNGIRKVAICDFDVHHGNGTESIFAGRSDVAFFSSQQIPLYPGTGDPARTSAANAFNLALPPGSGSDEFRGGWEARLLPELERFAPDLVLVSAGFDGHWRDPLAQLELKDEDFFWIGQQLGRIAAASAGGRLAASLEGGYDPRALADSSLAFGEGLLA